MLTNALTTVGEPDPDQLPSGRASSGSQAVDDWERDPSLGPGPGVDIGLSAEEWDEYQALRRAAEALLEDEQSSDDVPASGGDGQALASFMAELAETAASTTIVAGESNDQDDFLEQLSTSRSPQPATATHAPLGSAALEGVAGPRRERRTRRRRRWATRVSAAAAFAAVLAVALLVILQPGGQRRSRSAATEGSRTSFVDLATFTAALEGVQSEAKSIVHAELNQQRAQIAAAHAREVRERRARDRPLRHRSRLHTDSTQTTSLSATTQVSASTAPPSDGTATTTTTTPATSGSAHPATSGHRHAFGDSGVLGLGHVG